ncbi:TMhelix containing protein [Vibrio phage 1.231.O._10N.261.49.F8]|nr:TMhelix containing protein [Vibrio phage 1.119.O._10N.261.51.A9]AUR90383.1 TMhelix containing protein [Vibrio phage 1.143.O._10N.261.55.C8]AUR96669.1 TMhelix containing protein [Vibrio phage 1.231.O._10N.261.49.F8]
MKNIVRMQLDRNLHAQFKRVDGESNNERMSKLLADSTDKYNLTCLASYHKETAKEWRAMYKRKKAVNKTLASALVVSIAVSVCSVAYVCVVNGWFL